MVMIYLIIIFEYIHYYRCSFRRNERKECNVCRAFRLANNRPILQIAQNRFLSLYKSFGIEQKMSILITATDLDLNDQ